ncbi:MAG TPA: hypothetical protein VF591_08370 [Pyrinomonadaceae bacterium]|jgi:hypothetical protein
MPEKYAKELEDTEVNVEGNTCSFSDTPHPFARLRVSISARRPVGQYVSRVVPHVAGADVEKAVALHPRQQEHEFGRVEDSNDATADMLPLMSS